MRDVMHKDMCSSQILRTTVQGLLDVNHFLGHSPINDEILSGNKPRFLRD